ncbi:MAG TPA: hypothetical protein VEX67_05730 [Solirubrobacteraceae bacterium]|nr:hypothetical protein [Solirubrobacteraceae bacterium]
MRRLTCSALAAAALLLLPAAAGAAPAKVGIGEQSEAIFTNPNWKPMGAPDVRYIAPWDTLMTKWQRDETDAYMRAARFAGARVLLGFGHSRVKKRRRSLPSPTVFRREFLRFRKRYPFVTNYLTWNEANHCSQPTCRKPGRAARFYDILRKNCRKCTVSAPALLDKLDMPQWVRAFERKAKYRVKVWSLHNYIDANRFRTRGTRSLLRATKAKIWFTETGGLVRRDNGSRIEFADSPRHAVKATRWVIRLARLSKRVRRVYFYHWVAPPPRSTWDSALTDRRGRPRPSYDVVRTYMRHSRAANRKLAASRRAKRSR